MQIIRECVVTIHVLCWGIMQREPRVHGRETEYDQTKQTNKQTEFPKRKCQQSAINNIWQKETK